VILGKLAFKFLNIYLRCRANIEPLADRILLQTLAEAEEDPSPTDSEKTSPPRPISGSVARSQNTYSALKQALEKLQKKLREPVKKKFYLHKCHNSHILPLTNVSYIIFIPNSKNISKYF